MIKKTMLLAISVGALVAFAAPTAASAQQLLENGTPLAKGAEFTATSTNLVTTTAAGTLECVNVTIHAEVKNNKATTSEAVSKSVTTTNCVTTTPESVPTTITAASANFHLEPSGVGTAGATFIADIGPSLQCHFASTTPALGITYTTNTDSVHVEGTLVGTGVGCPSSGTIHGDFTLETSNGTAITIA